MVNRHMLLNELISESAKSDFERLAEANRVFRLIATWLREHGANAFFYQDANVYLDPNSDEATKVVKLTLDLNRVGDMPDAYRDLSLILTNMEQTQHGTFVKPRYGGHYYSHYSWHPHKDAAKVIVLYTHDLHVRVFEVQMASIFTHEFVHYLDDKRMSRGISKGYRPYQHAHGTPEHHAEYINNPVEFNAYYMQGIRAIVEDLDRIIRLRRDFPTNFRDFLYTFTVENDHFYGDFRTLMDAKWRQKFIKRLQGFHAVIMQRYRSGKPYDKLWWNALIKQQEAA